MTEIHLKSEKALRDYELVCAARDNGDQQAYAKLMDLYKDQIRLFMLKMTSNPDEADDLTIETFTKAFRQLHRYMPTNAFSTWLFAIASNNCIDHLRQKRLNVVMMSSLSHDENNEGPECLIPSNSLSPEEQLISTQQVERLKAIVEQMKPHYRRVIELRFFEELSYEEIAERLQLPMGTVKVHIMRARDLLSSILRQQNETI